MLDVRPTHWVTPLKEQPLDDLKPVVHVENFADEDCLVTGLVRIYRESTGTLVFDSVLLPTRVSGYQSAEIPTESTWSPGAPADHDYFIICETKAFDNLERHCFNSTLGPRFFDIKPGPMGPAPAAHAPTHSRGGMDVVEVEDLATDNTNAGDVLTSVGDGSICFSTPTGGGSGTPSNTVVSETSPGQSPAAGTATTYSRGDHTHGTPPASGGPAGLSFSTDLTENTSGPLGAQATKDIPPWILDNYLGNGAWTPVAGTPNHPGILHIRSGYTNQGGARLISATNSILLAGSEETDLVLNFDSLYRALLIFGLCDTQTPVEPQNGTYLFLDCDAVANTLYGKTANGGTRSTTTTGYIMTEGVWYRFRVKVNHDASVIDFYVLDESGATLWHDSLSTNIPTTTGHEVGSQCILSDRRDANFDVYFVDFLSLSIPRTLAR